LLNILTKESEKYKMENRTIFSAIRFNWFALIAGVFCLTMAVNVSAQQNARPCVEDAEKLCKGIQAGQGRLAQCLKEHSDQLSPACKANIAEAKEKIQDFTQACKDDMTKLCNGTKPGGGRILQCLKQHEAELTPACKEKMAQPKGKL
jgi:Cysteine rich repeat